MGRPKCGRKVEVVVDTPRRDVRKLMREEVNLRRLCLRPDWYEIHLDKVRVVVYWSWGMKS